MNVRRNNQTKGLQIAVACLVVAWLVTSVAIYLLATKANTQESKIAQLESELNQAVSSLDTAEDENSRLREMIGLTSTSTLETAEERFADDVSSYGAGLSGSLQTYRDMLRQFSSVKMDLNQRLSEATERQQDLMDRFTAMEESCQARLDVVQGYMDQLTAEFAEEREDFEESRHRIASMAEKLSSELERKRAEMYELVAKHNSELLDVRRKLSRQTAINETLREDLDAVTTGEYVESDGQVTWVSSRLKTVWLNVGKADKLQSQMTFSVFATQGDTVVGEKPKATIQVVRVIDSHLSEARITSGELTDPIIPGDAIHSPVWSPGKHYGVAIAGFIDIDGDGSEDVDRLRTIISMQGATVDSELKKGGSITGDVNAETRFVILGEEPDGTDKVYAEGYSRLLQQAKEFGVERISVNEFLDRTGAKRIARAVSYRH